MNNHPTQPHRDALMILTHSKNPGELEKRWQPKQPEEGPAGSGPGRKRLNSSQQPHAEELQWARRRLSLAEKREAMDAFRHGILNQSQQKLLADLDARLLRLESGKVEKSNGQNHDK
jgi:hypothetical protein